jgi:hypothetical protein
MLCPIPTTPHPRPGTEPPLEPFCPDSCRLQIDLGQRDPERSLLVRRLAKRGLRVSIGVRSMSTESKRSM